MSNSPLWRIKKQNPLFQKTKSKQALMTDLGAELGTLLAQLGQRACPSWATCLPQLGRFAVRRLPNKLMLQHPYSCFQDSANTYNSCRLNSFHLIILFIWQFSFHQQTIQTIGWQLPDSQLSVCQNITAKNQMVWQFLSNSWFLLRISDMGNFCSYRPT